MNKGGRRAEEAAEQRARAELQAACQGKRPKAGRAAELARRPEHPGRLTARGAGNAAPINLPLSTIPLWVQPFDHTPREYDPILKQHHSHP